MNSGGKTIWVVEATSSLGRSLVEKLVECGHFVIASGSDNRVLGSLIRERRGAVTGLSIDPSNPASVAAAGKRLLELTDRLDVLVVNSWERELSGEARIDAELCHRQVETNYLAMVRCVETALPLLQNSRSPYIVCPGSAVTRLPLAGAVAYGASAAAAEYFARALAVELGERNIDISIVRMGGLNSGHQEGRGLLSYLTIAADEAARRLIAAMDNRQSVIYLPGAMRWWTALITVLPGLWMRGILANINRRSGATW